MKKRLLAYLCALVVALAAGGCATFDTGAGTSTSTASVTTAPETASAPDATSGAPSARQPETTSKAPSASQPAASQPAAGAPTTGAPTTSKAPSASQPASSQAAHAQTVYWGHTGEKVHISPNCRTIKNGALSGTLAEARAAGRGDWCKVCSKGWSDERLKSEGNPNAD